MTNFNYKRAAEEIAQINAIVQTCPDAVKEKCFELLFGAVFSKLAPAAEPTEEKPAETKEDKPGGDGAQAPPAKKLPTNVLAFTRKYGVSEAELGKLFMLDHEPLLPIYNLPSRTAQAQLYKVMM